MTIKKISTASLLASLILWAGFSTPALANDQEFRDIARKLGALGPAPARVQTRPQLRRPQQRAQYHSQQRPQQKRYQPSRQQRKAVKHDPYTARRRQIHLQNIARRKAAQARIAQLAQQRRAKYQQAYRKKHPQQARRQVSRVQPRRAKNRQVSYRQNAQRQANHRNVWNRLYQGFRIRDYNYQPLVRRYTAEFSRNPRRIQQLANRSSQYLYLVVSELNRRNMPTELALLPFVESAYRNQAYSHAGAAGMWQFIPATGRRYGLRQTRSYDARLDPFQSTKAALSYLQKLNRQFHGDWLLSLAAYNAGEYRVQREIDKNRARGMRTDYWSLNLPRETKQYVPRLLAFKQIFRNPRRYRVQLQGIPNTHALTSIQINKPVDLKRAALAAGLPVYTLSSLNSGFLHGITTPRLSNRIIVPRQHAGRLNQIIRRMPAARDVQHIAARKTYRKKRRYSKRRYTKRRTRNYRVKRGDNLYQIAKKHGISVKKLKRLNKLRNNKIWPGKRLKVADNSSVKRRNRS